MKKDQMEDKTEVHESARELLLSQDERKTLCEEMLCLPRVTLSERQLCDLELLLNGGFYPLKGFLTEEEYISVLENLKLPNGAIWPMPIVLDVENAKGKKVGDKILLCDRYSKPLAVMDIESIYKPDKNKEAIVVYGTKDKAHFGVRMLFEQTYDTYIGGGVRGLAMPEYSDFTELRYSH